MPCHIFKDAIRGGINDVTTREGERSSSGCKVRSGESPFSKIKVDTKIMKIRSLVHKMLHIHNRGMINRPNPWAAVIPTLVLLTQMGNEKHTLTSSPTFLTNTPGLSAPLTPSSPSSHVYPTPTANLSPSQLNPTDPTAALYL
jgi:hypothetical protein